MIQVETYQKDMEEMEKMSKEEFLALLRRQSNGFSRGVSKYRGVARFFFFFSFCYLFLLLFWLMI